MKGLNPLGNRIIVKQITIDKIGNIWMAENSRETRELIATEGTVIKAGKSCKHISEGDEVYYGKYAGFFMDSEAVKRHIDPDSLNRDTYKIMAETDVIALVEGERK
jgi:co-chaperonin GroES (HSP10)